MADAVLATGFVLHTLALIVSVLWAAWSIQRHGWRKRSTRRLSYYMYVALHAVRLFWLAALARAGADATLDELELRSPTAAVLNRVALCLAFNAFSMLVFGWANVTSSGAGACARALPARRVFLLLNGAHWASHAGLCAALLAAAARGPSDRLRLLVRLDAALVVAFAAALAALAAAFGLMLSARFVQLAAAAADPTLGGYVTVKFNKVNVAWHVFCACFALRAVFLAAALPGVGPIVGRAHLYAFGYFTPDVVPTFVALVVLRKRTLPCTCCGLLSPPRTLDRSAAELHQQLIFSPSSLSRASAGGAGTSDGSESGGGRKDSSGGEM